MAASALAVDSWMSAADLALVGALILPRCCQAKEGKLEHPKHVVWHLHTHGHVSQLPLQSSTMPIKSHTGKPEASPGPEEPAFAPCGLTD